jgi:hypothetical protein
MSQAKKTKRVITPPKTNDAFKVILNRREVDFLGAFRAYQSLTDLEKARILDDMVLTTQMSWPSYIQNIMVGRLNEAREKRKQATKKRPVRKRSSV